MIVVRGAIVAIAAAAIVWLSAGLAASNAQEDLARLVATTANPDDGDYAQADELRRNAERRSAGRRPTLLEATLHMKGDDRAGAARLLEDIVAEEPENAEAWLLLSQASDEREAEARARVRALAPDVPPP